jgi:hypothetical protein
MSKLAHELHCPRHMAAKVGSKRQRINAPGGARYVRRNSKGQFKEVEDVGRSLQQDRQRKAKNVAKRGQGDRGDRR